MLGTTVLPRLLAEYLRLHPKVRVDLVLQDHRVDLLEDGLDAAIRAGTLPDSSLVARALAPLQLVVCASPAYLAARGTPETPADLAAHDCPDFAHTAEPGVWRFGGPRGDVAVAVSGSLRINSGQALRVAALEGAGIVMLPDVLVVGDLAEGRLVRLLAGHAAPRLPLHLLTLPDRRPTPKLRSFVEFITGRLGTAARRRRRSRDPASPADGAGEPALLEPEPTPLRSWHGSP